MTRARVSPAESEPNVLSSRSVGTRARVAASLALASVACGGTTNVGKLADNGGATADAAIGGASSGGRANGSGGLKAGTGGTSGGSTGAVDGSVRAVASPESGVCDPLGEIPCYAGFAEPCTGTSNGWAGDEYCLVPPTRGFQIHVGPRDYSNPDEVAKYVFPPGGLPADDPRAAALGTGPDVAFCFSVDTPNDTTFYAHRQVLHMRPGTHDAIWFATPDVADSTGPDSCSGSSGVGIGAFVGRAARPVEDVGIGSAPEDQFVVSEFAPHQQLKIRMHPVNITDKPILAEAWLNVGAAEFSPDLIVAKTGGIEWYGGVGMNIPPGTHTIVQAGSGGSCTAPNDLRILSLSADTHASTVQISLYVQKPADTTRSLVLQDFEWSQPTTFRFGSLSVNVPPNPASKTSGSTVNGDFYAAPGDAFSWECEIVNDTAVNLTFSDRLYDGEMCNVFGSYANPNPSGPWNCISF